VKLIEAVHYLTPIEQGNAKKVWAGDRTLWWPKPKLPSPPKKSQSNAGTLNQECRAPVPHSKARRGSIRTYLGLADRCHRAIPRKEYEWFGLITYLWVPSSQPAEAHVCWIVVWRAWTFRFALLNQYQAKQDLQTRKQLNTTRLFWDLQVLSFFSQ